jgi:poly(A) polymerase
MENVQLEQAVRDLNCFDGLEHSVGRLNHRTFALEYIEGILERWSRSVEEAKLLAEKQSQPSPPPGPPSFAAVTAGVSNATVEPKMSFADAVAPKSNVWDQPPPSVLGKESTSSKPRFTSNSPVAALIPFGSYRLGVHSIASDLDILALAPPYIERSDFFSSLVKLFQADRRCHDVHPISSAYTPVIKFVLECAEGDDISMLQIDLVFARVMDATKLVEYHRLKMASKQQGNAWNKNRHRVEYTLDDTDLEGLDEAGVRSLNGARVSQMLLESVQGDVGKFQLVLCAVKHWAVTRGIYSNVLGFLGGVNWAILVAWICKQYPNASASVTLQLFFQVFGQWNWRNPVLLTDTIAETPPITNTARQTRAVQLKAWNPQTNPRDGLHVMPIITPAYPSMNSSYNVDYPQLRFMQQEMLRTSALFKTHVKSAANVYRKLFVPTDFFDRHKHFLQINIRASNKQDFVEWFRLVESKIRLLVSTLETPEVHAWPLARFFEPKSGSTDGSDKAGDGCEKVFFIALRFEQHIDSMDVRPLTMDFLYKVNSWEGRKATMDLSITHITDKDLPFFVWEAIKHRHARNAKDHGAERSVNSENTAPATDDEEDDVSCRSNEIKTDADPPDLKKYRVEMTSEVN